MNLIYNRYKGDKTIFYYDDFMSVDTETSHDAGYTWLSSIQVYFQGKFFLFRKPSEFIDYLDEIIERYGLYNKRRLIVVIHNASYDLSYLIGYFQKYLPDKDDHSAIMRDKHNIVAYRQGGLDVRDTYALCNVSLEKWCNDLNTEHKKQVGLYDYNKIIYQDTELTADEIKYDEYDVLCLYECFKKQLAMHGDTLATVPYTSTGYVRRDCERICQKQKYYRSEYFEKTQLNLQQFNMCVSSFAGGYTHNNRFYNDKIIDNCVIGHRDFRSQYPTELRVSLLPLGKPRMYYDVFDVLKSIKQITLQSILDLYPKYSTITELYIKKAYLRDERITMPFMQYSKLNIIKQKFCIKDNGRILSFLGEATICVDNFMLKILNDQYCMKVMILKVLQFENQLIPECLKNLIDGYFKIKTDKKIEYQNNKKLYGEFHEKTFESQIDMMISKQKLNGIYGMFVQNPLQSTFDIDYDADEIITETLIRAQDDVTLSKLLQDFYSNRKKFLPYQVGVFVTALARAELYEYIITIGYENVFYCDTDSIFYRKTPEIEQRIEALNKIKHDNAEKLGAYIINSKGEKIYYDVFEPEEDLKMFKGLHSKCYAGVAADSNEFTCTIAGIPSKTLIGFKDGKPVYLSREEELSGITAHMKLKNPDVKVDNIKAINNLHDGFIFRTNTGTTCAYDKYMLKDDQIIDINGHMIQTMGGGVISKLEAKEIKNMDLFNIRGYKEL